MHLPIHHRKNYPTNSHGLAGSIDVLDFLTHLHYPRQCLFLLPPLSPLSPRTTSPLWSIYHYLLFAYSMVIELIAVFGLVSKASQSLQSENAQSKEATSLISLRPPDILAAFNMKIDVLTLILPVLIVWHPNFSSKSRSLNIIHLRSRKPGLCFKKELLL